MLLEMINHVFLFDEGKAGDRDHKQLLDMDRGLENVS